MSAKTERSELHILIAKCWMIQTLKKTWTDINAFPFAECDAVEIASFIKDRYRKIDEMHVKHICEEYFKNPKQQGIFLIEFSDVIKTMHTPFKTNAEDVMKLVFFKTDKYDNKKRLETEFYADVKGIPSLKYINAIFERLSALKDKKTISLDYYEDLFNQ